MFRSYVRMMCIAGVFVAAMLLFAAPADACPACSDALPSNPDGIDVASSGDVSATDGNLAGGFFWSIMFMLAIPLTLMATAGGTLFYLVKKADAAVLVSQTADASASNTGSTEGAAESDAGPAGHGVARPA